MEYILGILCLLLLLLITFLLCKIKSLHTAADEIRREFTARRISDTNVGIDLSSSDKRMRLLAADIDRELKQLRREHLRYIQGDRELKEAVTNISHDLRTPLTAICGYVELLSREEMSEKGKEYLRIIENRMEMLKSLTEEMFRYSVVTSGNAYDSRETVVLNEVLEESLAAYYGVFLEKGITPVIEITPNRITRQLNKAALFRVLENVLANAVKYSEGDLEVRLTDDGAFLFSNHAKELDEVLTGKLFDRFYTVRTGRNSTGLGLSIARTLTVQMGGTIRAAYENGRLTIKVRF